MATRRQVYFLMEMFTVFLVGHCLSCALFWCGHPSFDPEARQRPSDPAPPLLPPRAYGGCAAIRESMTPRAALHIRRLPRVPWALDHESQPSPRAHGCGCACFCVPMPCDSCPPRAAQGCADQEPITCGWVSREGWDESTPLSVKYASAFYFSISVVSTVGDAAPAPTQGGWGDLLPL